MSVTLEQTIRDAYAAFGRGDVDGYLGSRTDDFTFTVAGKGGVSGVWVGRQGIWDLAGKAMSLTGGTFHEEVEDVLANDRHAVVLARHRFVSNGASRDYLTTHIYEIKDGKLFKCFEQPRDPALFDDAWAAPT